MGSPRADRSRLLLRASALAGAGCLAACSPPAGSHDSAIVGGAPTSEHPAVVALQYDGEYHCSAVLLSPTEAVTAGHCIYGFENDLAPLSVSFGPDPAQPEAERALVSVAVHPEYATTPSHDLAMVTFDPPVQITPAIASDAALDALAPPLDLTLVGFGHPDGSQQGPHVRRVVDVALSELTSTALRWDDLGAGTCHGDSGGAAFADLGAGLVLVGVHSEGDPQCSGRGSAVRTDVFFDFLTDPGAPGDDDDTVGFLDDDDSVDLPTQDCACDAAATQGTGLGWWLVGALALAGRRRRE